MQFQCFSWSLVGLLLSTPWAPDKWFFVFAQESISATLEPFFLDRSQFFCCWKAKNWLETRHCLQKTNPQTEKGRKGVFVTLWKTPGLTDLPGKKALLIQTIMVSSWASIVKSLLPQCCSQDNRYTHMQKKYNQDSLEEKGTTQWRGIFLTLYLRKKKSRQQRAGFWLVKRIQQWWVMRGPQLFNSPFSWSIQLLSPH